ncbi:hypothetical protein [Rhizobium lusitanum]|uniref:hypothetical protein n=1 Tax=Rhizobium lusitanum TaxID=293958 RepID=UPI000DE13060|nr:hypothetical protein [Rhizobium lusitanum]NTJ07897.1 hypothetical protein [Rhizobium lusitanum]
MEFVKLKRLGEVQEKLKTVLSELGLKPRYDRNWGRDICFQNEDGSLHHTVTIRVTDAFFEDSPHPWKGTCLSISGVGEEPLGYGDWKFVEWGSPSDTPKFRGDTDEIFIQIATYLKEYPVLRIRNSHPDLIDNTDFVKLLRAIEPTIQDKTDSSITVKRTEGVLSINFDIGDDKWRIDVANFKAKLIVNDKEVDKVDGFHVDEAKEMIWKELGKRRVPDLGF